MPNAQPLPWDPAMAANIAQAPTTQTGAPGPMNSMAGIVNTPPLVMAPPANPQEEEQRVAGWTQHLNDIMASPEMMMIGYALMNGRPLGNAFMAAQMYRMFEEQNLREEEQKAAEFAQKQKESEANIAQSEAAIRASDASAESTRADIKRKEAEGGLKEFELANAPEMLELERRKTAADIAQSGAAAAASAASAARSRAETALILATDPKEKARLEKEIDDLKVREAKAKVDMAEEELKHVREKGTKIGTAGEGKGGLTANQKINQDVADEGATTALELQDQAVRAWLEDNPDELEKLRSSSKDEADFVQKARSKWAADPANAGAIQNFTAIGKAQARSKRKESK